MTPELAIVHVQREEPMTTRMPGPVTVDELATIERRHQPHERNGYTWCSRDCDEFWPCDAARLLATLGDAYLAGALAEYREGRRTTTVAP